MRSRQSFRAFLVTIRGIRYIAICGIHNDDAGNCDNGRCVETKLGHGAQYDDPPKLLALVIKCIVFDEIICVNQTVC